MFSLKSRIKDLLIANNNIRNRLELEIKAHNETRQRLENGI